MKKILFSICFLAVLASCGNKPAEANGTATSTATAPATTTTTTPPAPQPAAEAVHSTVVSINSCQPSGPEEGEDIGFYTMKTEDEFVKMTNLFNYKQDENVDKIDIKTKDGKSVKVIDAKPLMGKDCAGFLVSKEGKAPAFIPLNADIDATIVKVKEYFK
jgi:hypothetical protein